MKLETTHAISFVGGLAAFLLGGFDSLLIALLFVMLCDWLTGVLKAVKRKKFSPDVGLWGIVNKVVTLLVVVTVNLIQVGLNMNIPLREPLIVMLLINEGLSVLGNASTFVKGLEPVAQYFESVKLNAVKLFKVSGGD